MSEKPNADIPPTEKDKFEPRQLRSIFDIIQDLSKDIPDKYLQTKQRGGKDIEFISWHNATKLLDYYANGWQFEIKEIVHIAGKVAFIVRLGIPSLEGMIWREASGNEDDDLDSYGDPFTNSESQALRRAAAKFGLARYLYKGDKGQSQSRNTGNQQNRNSAQSSRQGNQGSSGAMASVKQIGFMEKLAKDSGESEIEVVQNITNGAKEYFADCTMGEAKEIIDYYKGVLNMA